MQIVSGYRYIPYKCIFISNNIKKWTRRTHYLSLVVTSEGSDLETVSSTKWPCFVLVTQSCPTL